MRMEVWSDLLLSQLCFKLLRFLNYEDGSVVWLTFKSTSFKVLNYEDGSVVWLTFKSTMF